MIELNGAGLAGLAVLSFFFMWGSIFVIASPRSDPKYRWFLYGPAIFWAVVFILMAFGVFVVV